MTNGKKPRALSGTPSFEAVLDETCERLWHTKIQYSLRRIRDMESLLIRMEQELDLLLSGHNGTRE
ncbi:MAG: hypothetical protein LBP32_07160 [Spirochaetaceae bacterium]|jgi:hypothetical protein|nr:hypothetical protein [Spirochaetaceae bacterium]